MGEHLFAARKAVDVFYLVIGKGVDDLNLVVGEGVYDFPQAGFVSKVFNLFDFDGGKGVHNFDFDIGEVLNELDFAKEFAFVRNLFGKGLLAQG